MQRRLIVGAGLVFGAIVVVTIVTSISNRELYLTVDELAAMYGPTGAAAPAAVLASPRTGSAELLGRRLQVRGAVDRASVERSASGLDLQFLLTGQQGRLPVVYHGVVPDTFEQAQTITVGGHVGADGTFVADQLFVQCPSKYEPAPPGKATSA
jgi:cytochrome c-type biogenesis protein CcmE